MNDGFPPIYGHNRWINPVVAPDDQDTVRFTNNPLGLAATMSERAADSGHDTATIHTEPFLRREAGRWQILALATVVLGMIIGAPVAYSAMTPTGSAPAAAPSALPAIEVAPLPSATPSPSVVPSPSTTATPAAGPAGPQGPAGVTTVIYVPVASSTSSRSTSTTTSKPKPKPDPYAKYAHGSDCGTQTERWSSGHAYASFGHGVYEVPFSCPDWKYGMGTRTSTPNGTVVNPPAK